MEKQGNRLYPLESCMMHWRDALHCKGECRFRYDSFKMWNAPDCKPTTVITSSPVCSHHWEKMNLKLR